MKKKILGILVMTLLITTALPVVGTMNIEKSDNIKSDPKSSSADIVWSDNFDSYSLGQFLDGDPEDGGWKICPCPYTSEGAYVVDDQNLSNPHSVEIIGETDIIHDFTGIRSGNWTFSFWVYVPSEFSGKTALALDSYQPDPWVNKFVMRQLVVFFYGGIGKVIALPGDNELPLITDQWVELRIEFDLEADWLECYYNDELLIAKTWTEDIIVGTGFRNLAAVTMAYSNFPMDTPIYYDDFSLEGEATGPVPNLNCDGSINRDNVRPGSTVEGSFTVENIGEPNSRLEWVVAEYPEWGSNWESQPWKGMVTPEDDPMTVEVSFKAPDKKSTGVIKVYAIGDPDDYYEIPVSVTIKSRNKAINNPFLQFLQNHLNLFPVLQMLLQRFGLQ